MRAAPAFISFILHCFTRSTPFENSDAPYYRKLISDLYVEGIIEIGDQSDVWVLSDKGIVYCGAILEAAGNVPYPYWTCDKK